MREVSFVKRLRFNFDGSVTKRALVIGDADNDRRNELVCANLQGDLAIFKDKNQDKYAYASNLGMVTACSIGDIINHGKNHVTAINMEGWLFMFDVAASAKSSHPDDEDDDTRPPSSTCGSQQHHASDARAELGRNASSSLRSMRLNPMYEQRMPANCKEMLLADLDGDGQNELIIGLTDRVLRTYKWVKIGPEQQGKFVGLYKWEFADQIGSVSLNPSRYENCQDIIVAQPGGTYAKLECFDKKPVAQSPKFATPTCATGACGGGGGSPPALVESAKLQDLKSQQESSHTMQRERDNLNDDGDNVRTEYVNKLTPEYHQLALSQMRNHHVSTEVLGTIKDGRDSNSYSLIVIATLDGTLMLVNKDQILWSLQVDHQLFALAVLESGARQTTTTTCRHTLPQSESTCTIVPTSDLSSQHSSLDRQTQPLQHFVACAWNGKTYIIDEERNYLRFKFDEAVSAFTAGDYHFDDEHHSSLVYATFNNQIILYYDVLLDSIRPEYLLNEIMNNPNHKELLEDLHKLAAALESPDEPQVQQEDSLQEDNQKTIKLYKALTELLYNINDLEISALSSEPD